MDHTPELPQNLRKQESSCSEEEYGPEIPLNIRKKSFSLLENKISESDSSNTYGPVLPLHLRKNDFTRKKDDDDAYGPSLPPHLLKSSSISGDNRNSAVVSVHLGTNASSVVEPQNDSKNGEGNTLFGVLRPQGDVKGNENNTSDNDEYGPSLPPHLQNSASSKKQVSPGAVSKDRDLTSGKTNKRTYGPMLPPEIMATSVASDDDEEEEDDYCPDMPPHLKMKQSSHSYFESNSRVEDQLTKNIPDDQQSSEDDEVYGPMPPTQPVDMDEYIESTLQQRTEATQRRLQDANNTALRREDWMLTLPEDRPLFSGLGLQARQFSKSGKRDRGDTSVWTDTPADKERKAKRAAEGRAPEKKEQAVEVRTSERDERLQAAVQRHNDAKRSKPLIETHQGHQKKARKDGLSVTGVGVDRKPFSREEDLCVNKFDEAQKSSILKKARGLNDRFSSGKSSKFL
ncbi:Protein of unknown function DUF3752 [Trinorchestia longiramus]|nr:Protein of unknown function DUF3752 [Trinorchestia longiramus]